MAIQKQKSKDEMIVFQNQSHLVQKYFKDCNICPDLLDVCMVTDLMVRFTIEGYSSDLKTRFDNMEKYLQDKYGSKE